jgi:hypothetical protein
MKPLTRILKSVNSKSELLDESFIDEFYQPFLINKILSQFTDCVSYVADMDRNQKHLTYFDQYHYYYLTLRKKYRYTPWIKPYISDDVQYLMDYYNLSLQKSLDTERIIAPHKMAMIRKLMTQGGRM